MAGHPGRGLRWGSERTKQLQSGNTILSTCHWPGWGLLWDPVMPSHSENCQGTDVGAKRTKAGGITPEARLGVWLAWGQRTQKPLIRCGSSSYPAAPRPAPSDTPDAVAWGRGIESGVRRGATHPGTSTQKVRAAFQFTTMASASSRIL